MYRLLHEIFQTIHLPYRRHGHRYRARWKSCKLEQKKALLQFPTAQNEEVLVKVGISAVDIKGAQRNVETEIPSWDFDSIMTATQNKWNDYLETIQVEGNNETQTDILHSTIPHGYTPQPFFRCGRALSWARPNDTSNQTRQRNIHGLFTMGYFSCIASTIDHHQTRFK